MRQERKTPTLVTLGTDSSGSIGSSPVAAPLLVALALGIVYVVWGSTYLAIRIVVEDLPPLASASWRFLLAGAILALWLAARSGISRLWVTRAELLGCVTLGLLLPAAGNGLVVVAESRGAPSGIAALLIAAVPLWVVIYRSCAGDRPSPRTLTGVIVGFAGLVGLISASGLEGDVPIAACLLIVVAAMCWSFGSWSTSWLRLPQDPFVTAVYEMIAGSGFLLLGALLRGEDVVPRSAPLDAWLAWGYLVTFGSVMAFTAYVWVLQAAPISLVATYAYVNPVVAVFLGWLILEEAITPAIVIGGGVVVASVAIVVSAERQVSMSTETAQPPRQGHAHRDGAH